MAFPSTRHSILDLARHGAGELRHAALSELVAAYWKPVYQYIRLKWQRDPADAEDLTQSFFVSLLERPLLERYDPTKASFRTYLRLCIDGHAGHAHEASRRLKRGGGQSAFSLDFPGAERELAPLLHTSVSLDELFHREWQRHMFSLAVADLRAACDAQNKSTQFAIFAAYDLAEDPRPTYSTLAGQHSIPVTQVTNYLAWARRELRRLLLERLERISPSEQQYRADARQLLGDD